MLTTLAVFNDPTDPAPVLRSLADSGLDVGRVGLVWREKSVRKVEDIEIITYVDHFATPKEEAKKGAVGGLIGGAGTVAAGAALASAGFVINPELLTISLLPLTTAAVAAGGGLTGGAIGALLGATDHDATKVTAIEKEEIEAVERIGFVLSVEVMSNPEPVAEFLYNEGAADVTVLDSEGAQIRIHLDLSDEPHSNDKG